MNNKQFIRDYSFTNTDKRNGNLINENMVLYSYGYHYPLLFEVNGLKFVNSRGYSSTTSKHISIAKFEADYSVKLDGRDFDLDAVNRSLEKEKETILNDIATCKRKVSQKKDRLFTELNRVIETMEALKDTERYRS